MNAEFTFYIKYSPFSVQTHCSVQKDILKGILKNFYSRLESNG